MIAELKNLLEYLESSIPIEKINASRELYIKALNWEKVPRLPLMISYPFPDDSKFKPFPHNEIFDNPEKMLYNELVYAFGSSIALQREVGDDRTYVIRANFGTVVIASIFGAKIEQQGDNPPWAHHYKTWDDFQRVFDCDPFDFTKGECSRVLKRCQFYREALADYPILSQNIQISLPDLQGPLDNAELLRGMDIFTDFYERPDKVQDILQRMASAQVAFAKKLKLIIDEPDTGFCSQHGVMLPGSILVRNDSSIMLSPEMYREQVKKHDEFVLQGLGGGGIHSCGRMDHLAEEYASIDSCLSIDTGQSEMNDIDHIYNLVKEKKISLIRISASREELINGSIINRFPTGVALRYNASSINDAMNIMKNILASSIISI
jgi:hypothetical protein